MIDRFGVTNKNVLAKFVALANEKRMPISIDGAHKLARDKNFPAMETLLKGDIENVPYYSVEKSNGRWQVQKWDPRTEKFQGITPWLLTKKFEAALDFAIALTTGVDE
jgi:hypothetical protein